SHQHSADCQKVAYSMSDDDDRDGDDRVDEISPEIARIGEIFHPFMMALVFAGACKVAYVWITEFKFSDIIDPPTRPPDFSESFISLTRYSRTRDLKVLFYLVLCSLFLFFEWVLKTLVKPTCEITARALYRFELARFIVPKRGQQPVAVTGRLVVEYFRVTAM
ncbi:hypothetical protein L195_g031684, partial [Trifolium pratense]